MNQDERDLRDAIEHAVKEQSFFEDPSFSVVRKKSYLAGITHERQRKAEEVAKGFEEWYTDTYDMDVSYDPDNCCGKAWMAATQLAEQKAQEEIDYWKSLFEHTCDLRKEEFDQFVNAKKDIEELKADLGWCLSFLTEDGYDSSFCEEWNKCREIQKKHFHDRQKQLADKEK